MKGMTRIILIAVLVVASGFAGYLLLRDRNASDPGRAANLESIQNSVDEKNGENKEGYYFEYNGVEMAINDRAEPILEKLGEPMNYFEAPSCAFEGMDKIYSYPGFDLQTYTKGDDEYVYSILFLDDSVTTREGIGLNATLKQITEAYGNDYENTHNQYTYYDGNCRLSFLLENDGVISVEYSSTVDND